MKEKINSINSKAKEESININEILEPYLKKWYVYLISILTGLMLVYFYVRYTIPIYQNSASIIINEDDKNSSSGLSLLQDLEFVQSSSNLMNELEIMKSHSVLSPVIDSLNLNVTYFLLGDNSKLRRYELFSESPIHAEAVFIDELSNTSLKNFNVKFNSFNTYEIETNGIIKTVKFDEVYSFKDIKSFNIKKTKNFDNTWIGRRIEVIVSTKQKAIEKLRNEVQVEKKNKESSVVTISIQGSNQEKNNAVLNEVLVSYRRDGLNDKNTVKSNTSNFIKERIKFLLEELNEVEVEGENYKKTQGIVDYQIDINDNVSSKSNVENLLIESNIQLNLVSLLELYMVENEGNSHLLPSNIGFLDQSIIALTDQYNKLILEKKKYLQNTKLNNPLVVKIENQLNSIKESLLLSLKNLKKNYELKEQTYNKQFAKFNEELNSMPKFEREYRSIIRQQQIKESLYLFLLQKREENEIELAASVTNIKVIIPPNGEGVLISPKKTILYIAAFVIFLFIPIVIIYILQFFDNKIKGSKDLGDFTQLGQIPQSNKANSIIDDTDRSFLSESFRMLRTNINFSLSDKVGCKVIALSSTLPNEGKTFISMNLANSLSKAGSKVIVVGLDLRMPKLIDYVNIINSKGVSNFIIDESLTPSDIINSISDKNELYMINAGDIPPNPAELLLKPRFKELMGFLRENFDYIIIDTSPIGLISDCLPIVKNETDLLLYVARVGYLQKKFLSIPRAFINEGVVDNLAVVLNYTDPFDKKYGYGYGYGGYTNGYFSEKSRYTWLSTILGFFKKK
jgi:tyrosine-protein kinase Etk/Wzc